MDPDEDGTSRRGITAVKLRRDCTGWRSAAALLALLGLTAWWPAGQLLAAGASVAAVQMPPERLLYPDDSMTIRVVIVLGQGRPLAPDAVHYTLYDLQTGEAVSTGDAPFRSTAAIGGWADITPNVRTGDGIRWYRAVMALEGGGQVVALENPSFVFGVAPEPGTMPPALRESAPLSPSEFAGPAKRKVMAFYYTWYGNPAVSKAWVHWPEGGHNPEQLSRGGLPDLGATNHPLLGAYDSNNPRVIRQHLAWAEAAGIDVLISTWWGQGDRTDRIMDQLLDAAKETQVRVSIYYERVPNDKTQAAIDDLLYIGQRYASHPAFFRAAGGPVIFVYGRALHQLPRHEWERVIAAVKEQADITLIADSTDGQWAALFDGLHTYNPVGQIVRRTNMQRAYDMLVKAAHDQGKIAAVTVIPGYDDSNIGRQSPTVAGRQDGLLYDTLWQQAIASSPDWVLITSFNEWHEGSEIEPSIEDGRRYLEQTRTWANRFQAAALKSFEVGGASIPAVVAPGGVYQARLTASPLAGQEPPGLTWQLPAGWQVIATTSELVGSIYSLATTFAVSSDTQPGRYPVAARLSLAGYSKDISGQIVVPEPGRGALLAGGTGVWVNLGAKNSTYGLTQSDQADGRTTAVEVGGVAARKTVRGVSDHKYMYFDVADQFLYDISGQELEVLVEFLDSGYGSFQVQYDSHNQAGALQGAYTNTPPVRLQDSGEWRVAHIKLLDARLANRQNGGTDFRLYAGTGELIVRSVYLRCNR
jgi:glycoprotein endo-alpha-1,2-mannosidase